MTANTHLRFCDRWSEQPKPPTEGIQIPELSTTDLHRLREACTQYVGQDSELRDMGKKSNFITVELKSSTLHWKKKSGETEQELSSCSVPFSPTF